MIRLANRFCASVVAVCLAVLSSSGQTNPPDIRLAGIISLAEPRIALLEIQNSHGRAASRVSLGEGQRDQGARVLQIDAPTETVEVSWDGAVRTLRFDADGEAHPAGDGASAAQLTIHLERLEVIEALSVYGDLAERNVILPSLPKSAPISLRLAAASRSEAAQALADAVRRRGLTTILEGDKFAIIAPDSDTNRLVEISREIRSNIARDAASWTNASVMPPRVMKFTGAPAEQVLDLYAKYTDRRLVNKADLASPTMFRQLYFYNLKALNRADTCYAMEMTLACHGIRIVRNADDTFNAEPFDR